MLALAEEAEDLADAVEEAAAAGVGAPPGARRGERGAGVRSRGGVRGALLTAVRVAGGGKGRWWEQKKCTSGL